MAHPALDVTRSRAAPPDSRSGALAPQWAVCRRLSPDHKTRRLLHAVRDETRQAISGRRIALSREFA